jgi:pimeloyl-ACP methyl ester carboxylesterase
MGDLSRKDAESAAPARAIIGNMTPESLSMRSKRVLCLSQHGFHAMHYTDWGDPRSPRTAICVHGLTRNGRDFDRLAAALSARWRVACPDVVGRGRSDWLAVPAAYNYPQYCADMAVLIARLDVEAVDWVGTSMGGLIGLMLAAQPGSPIRRLVLNDVGPFLAKAALQRIATYVGQRPTFATLDALEAYLRQVYAPFGPMPDTEWRHIAEHSHRRLPDGRLALHHDPKIAENAQAAADRDVDLWALWDRITCPVLVIRGAESDLLSAEVAAEMTRRGPKARLVELPGVGHAPALRSDAEIALVQDFLGQTFPGVAT